MTKSGKHCNKRRNCTFCAISFFVTMFSKSRLLQRRQKVSIWGKGLNNINKSKINAFLYLEYYNTSLEKYINFLLIRCPILWIYINSINSWLAIDSFCIVYVVFYYNSEEYRNLFLQYVTLCIHIIFLKSEL